MNFVVGSNFWIRDYLFLDIYIIIAFHIFLADYDEVFAYH